MEADLPPEEKAGKLEEPRRRGATMAMVGDGVNDAPALARADAASSRPGVTLATSERFRSVRA